MLPHADGDLLTRFPVLSTDVEKCFPHIRTLILILLFQICEFELRKEALTFEVFTDTSTYLQLDKSNLNVAKQQKVKYSLISYSRDNGKHVLNGRIEM